jgi:hypothetical protein
VCFGELFSTVLERTFLTFNDDKHQVNIPVLPLVLVLSNRSHHLSHNGIYVKECCDEASTAIAPTIYCTIMLIRLAIALLR